MKKIVILASMTLLVFSLMMVSCKNNSDSSSGNSGGSGSSGFLTSVVGTWKTSDGTEIIKFNSGGTYTYSRIGYKTSGTYYFEPGKNSIELDDEDSFAYIMEDGSLFWEGANFYR